MGQAELKMVHIGGAMSLVELCCVMLLAQLVHVNFVSRSSLLQRVRSCRH